MEFDFVKLEEIFDLGNISYYAHHKIENETKKNETLQNHIFLSEKYYKLIIEEKKFDKIFDKIFNSLKFEEENRKFYYKLISNIVSFHDFGKINPEYQKQKMKNKDINGLPIDIEGIKGADHSLFSSAVYIDYFFKRIDISFIREKDLSKRNQGFLLIELILNFAYLISKHHSDLIEFEDFLQNKDMKNILENLSKIQFLKKSAEIENRVEPIVLLNIYCNQRKNISLETEDIYAIFVLNRIVFSLLVGADYYATSEFMKDIETNFFGNIENILDFQNEFENNEIIKGIRKNSKFYLNKEKYEEFENINEYRSKIFLEAESILMENLDKDVFFLEAPTGSGKSNTALNLGFKLLDEDRRKIFYVYPFNTLVEQNKDTIENLFSEKNLLYQIRVVNSITPFDNGSKEDEYISYDKILLDRQFLNYPLIITTHVGIFDILIGNTKGNVMPFYQLANSVIIFDEIQAYRSEIWTEIMMTLEKYARILNIKIIMMSATLPDLASLTQNKNVVRLMKNRDFYFKAPIFKDRVELDFDLLDREVGLEEILDHIINNSLDFSKILVEFISKKEAKSFYKICKEENLDRDILILTGEDNRARRKEVINEIKKENKKILLISTQLIEAGVDIDMDVGYKDISAIDNEEQFLGRINRSCKRKGKAYFFNLKDAKNIYRDSISIINDLNLYNLKMRECLLNKDFSPFFSEEIEIIKNKNKNFGEKGIEEFKADIWNKNFSKIKNRLCLIRDEGRKISYFFSRNLIVDKEELNGFDVWQEYKEILCEKDYAKQKVKLSRINEKMSYFTYEIYYNPKTKLLNYNDRIGELFYIEDGDKYFDDGVLNIKDDEELFI